MRELESVRYHWFTAAQPASWKSQTDVQAMCVGHRASRSACNSRRIMYREDGKRNTDQRSSQISKHMVSGTNPILVKWTMSIGLGAFSSTPLQQGFWTWNQLLTYPHVLLVTLSLLLVEAIPTTNTQCTGGIHTVRNYSYLYPGSLAHCSCTWSTRRVVDCSFRSLGLSVVG